MVSLQTLIFRELKQRPRTTGELQVLTKGTIHDIESELIVMMAKGWVFLNSDHQYQLVRVLDPPLNIEREYNDAKAIWNYDIVKQEDGKQLQGAANIFRTPYEQYLPKGWMQDQRGTCVGHGQAVQMQSNYYARTGDFPTPEEMAQAIANQLINVNNKCMMRYDKWYRTIFSAQWCYHISRIVGNVTYPSGSYCSAAIKAMKQYGSVLWDECLTSRVANCAPETYPNSFDECVKLAVGHKIDGYVTITSFKSLMDAIEKDPVHCVLMPINMYDGPFRDGYLLPIGGELIGSHALPWCFVDRIKGRVGCWNSWGWDYPQITWIDEDYYNKAAGAGFLPIDANEVLIAKKFYSIIRVKTNIPCTITINDRTVVGTEASASYLKGAECTIRAVSQLPMYEPPEYKETFLLQEAEYIKSFTFTKTDTKCWIRKLIDDILKKMRKK